MRTPPKALRCLTSAQSTCAAAGVARSLSSSIGMKYSPGSIVTTMPGCSTRVSRK